LLLQSAEIVYPTLHRRAADFVESIPDADPRIFVDDEGDDFHAPSGRHKATIGAMTAVLRPGKAVQVSIQDNQWFKDPRVLNLPPLQALRGFLDALLG